MAAHVKKKERQHVNGHKGVVSAILTVVINQSTQMCAKYEVMAVSWMILPHVGSPNLFLWFGLTDGL